MLAYAAEQSFQVIALIPLVLFVIFGAVWYLERRHRLNTEARVSPAE